MICLFIPASFLPQKKIIFEITCREEIIFEMTCKDSAIWGWLRLGGCLEEYKRT
jgi:hypothetical protein